MLAIIGMHLLLNNRLCAVQFKADKNYASAHNLH